MLKRPSKKVSIAISSGCVLLVLLGAGLLGLRWMSWVETVKRPTVESIRKDKPEDPSAVFSLALVPAEQRAFKLEEIATSSPSQKDRDRARYLLASDLIAQNEGEQALLFLENLEADYPILAPYILLQRAQAYDLMGNSAEKEATLQQLETNYPDSPAVAEALYWQGEDKPEVLNRILSEFPSHPRAIAIARQRLTEDPAEPLDLLLILAKGDAKSQGTTQVRDRLVNEYASQLQPEDWEAIAYGYWETWEYGKAGKAYAKAEKNPKNFYRAARGLQLAGENAAAIDAYKLLVNLFPNASETGLGLQRLASLSSPEEAIKYLDTAIEKFPDQAPEALLIKAKQLDSLKKSKEAAQARETILKDYPTSDATVEYRWEKAQQFAQNGERTKAYQWIEPVIGKNTTSELSPKASYWAGKWAKEAGETLKAKEIFEQTLTHYPESYYAWRSAVNLGWDVGDFTTVRSKIPQVEKPPQLPTPPAGSEAFKELYSLGQSFDAFALWQQEQGNSADLTVGEQFTEGLVSQSVGKYLQGINSIWQLQFRDEPAEVAEWEKLRQQPDYWYALFPFPYDEYILYWSQQRQINPLLVTSLMRQESRFEKEIRSVAGATGLMQVMPGTADYVASAINLPEYSLTDPNDNINLGTWYMYYTHQEYSNHSLLAIASYNAGPGNVNNWLQRFNTDDPDTFVEKIPFPETQGYVESVFGNYWNYLRIYNPEVSELMSQYTEKQ